MREKWDRFIRNKPIGVKMNIFCITLIIIPFLALGMVFGNILSNSLHDQVRDRAESYINQSVQSIEMNLSELDSIMISGLWDSNLSSVLRSGDPVRAEQNAFVSEKLRSMANSRKDIRSLVVARKDGARFVFDSGENATELENSLRMLENDLYADDRLHKGRTLWVNCPNIDGTIIGIRKLYDFETLDDLGYLYLVLKNDTIQKQYNTKRTTSGSFFILLDAYGDVVSRNGEANVDLSLLTPYDISNEIISADGTHYYRSARLSEDTGWLVNMLTPERELFAEVRRMYMILFATISVICAILLILTNRFANHIVTPLTEIEKLMKEVHSENFDIHAADDREDELGSLAKSFNSMAARIKQLIDEDYRNKLLIQETEYRYLRAQINPHFLYNTLDSISWLAAIDGNKNVSRMAVALGRILRWSISNKKKMVMLREVMDIIRDYLMIQKMRYGESLKYEISISEAEKDMLIPKMIVQPIVENALIHGLENKDGEKQINISASSNGVRLTICIEDNGIGIPREKLEKILEEFKTGGADKTGVGLSNVNRRIRMLFGDAYGLEIDSRVEAGTRINIYLPIDEAEAE